MATRFEDVHQQLLERRQQMTEMAEEMASLGDPDDGPQSPYPAAAAADNTSWRRRWASMLLLSVCVGLFVLLACVYVHSTRVASLCVLAAQSLVENLATIVGGATAKRFGPGSRGHAPRRGCASRH